MIQEPLKFPAGKVFRSLFRCWLTEGGPKVTGPMQNPHDLNPTGNGEIEDDVTPHRKAAQTIGQLVQSSADAGLLRQHLELLVDHIDERIGMGVAVIGDELPDFNQISLGAGLENNHLDGSRALGGSAAGRLAPASVLLDLLRIPGGRLPAA